jgi:hypothetical protein
LKTVTFNSFFAASATMPRRRGSPPLGSGRSRSAAARTGIRNSTTLFPVFAERRARASVLGKWNVIAPDGWRTMPT